MKEMKKILGFTLLLVAISGFCEAPISRGTVGCMFCHEKITPGIVADWESSRHAATTPARALGKPSLERRVSLKTSEDIQMDVAVGCMECHGIGDASRPDNFSHFGFSIQTIVTPDDCSVCHSTEALQYSDSKKAHAIANLKQNPVYSLLVEEILSVRTMTDGELKMARPSAAAEADACFGCHGTVVGVDGTRQVRTSVGTAVVPKLTNWPNQGVGRVNPDGSAGSCSACHPRHGYSIEVARSPSTCGQCHLEPDVPAYNVYKESKHGNLYESSSSNWDMGHVPWRPGTDFTAPTCAACHVSLLASKDGDVFAERSHDFGSRLWVRIFGLITSHPQPENGRTYLLRNDDGQPLPVTFGGVAAPEGLIGAEEQLERQGTMKKVCSACHSTGWSEGFFEKFSVTVSEADRMVLSATELLGQAWEAELADPENPFNEPLEHLWISQWLIYANSLRYASAMSGPDYAAFKNGWWNLTTALAELHAKVADGTQD